MTRQNDELVARLDEAMTRGTTGRDALPNLLRDCKAALTIGVAASLTPKEAERLQRLRSYAYELQNRLDRMPSKFEMGFTRARLSAICWAVEKISGIPFKPESVRPEADAEAAALSVERAVATPSVLGAPDVQSARRAWHRALGADGVSSCPTDRECIAFDAGFSAAARAAHALASSSGKKA